MFYVFFFFFCCAFNQQLVIAVLIITFIMIKKIALIIKFFHMIYYLNTFPFDIYLLLVSCIVVGFIKYNQSLLSGFFI